MMVDEFASPWTESSEAWILNPGRNIDLCFSYGITDFVFPQKTYQFKRNMAIAPQKLIAFAARGRPWRALLVEYNARVSLLYSSERGWNSPVAAYPSWSARDDKFSRLKWLCSRYPQPGEEVGMFWGEEVPIKAVKGQEKVILIRNLPNDMMQWQTVMSYVTDMKRMYPHIRFHMHGGKSIARTVGISIDAFDHPVTIDWIGGVPRLLLPNGQIHDTSTGEPRRNDHWAKLIGESLAEFRRLIKSGERAEVSRFTYNFNLKSLLWACRNQESLYAFQGRRPDEDEVDLDAPDESWVPKLTRYRPRIVEVGDKWLCDTCTIASRCPYSRSGAICIVPGTEAHKLSEKMRSRKTSDIIDGISALLGGQTERFEKALLAEQEVAAQTGQYRLSPQVTTLGNAIFDRAIQMARLMDPQIAGQMSGTRVNVGIMNGNAGAIAGATNQELMAGVAAKLESFGIPLAQATIEQVEAVIRGEDPTVRGVLDVGSDDADE